MSRRISRLSLRFVLTLSSFVFITALAAPRLAHAHNGVIHSPEAPPEPTPDVGVSASPGGDHQVYLPVVIVEGSFHELDELDEPNEPVQTLPTPEPAEQKSHEQNDYDLAEDEIENAVLGMENSLPPRRLELGDHFGKANAQVDIGAVGDVLGGAPGDLGVAELVGHA